MKQNHDRLHSIQVKFNCIQIKLHSQDITQNLNHFTSVCANLWSFILAGTASLIYTSDCYQLQSFQPVTMYNNENTELPS
jgi:hypothetical protein